MRHSVDLKPDLERKLHAYRDKRRQETGKVMHAETAIRELLAKALEGVEPARPAANRLDDLERRVAKLEMAGMSVQSFPVPQRIQEKITENLEGRR